jgi:small subunit ribosomal protein S17
VAEEEKNQEETTEETPEVTEEAPAEEPVAEVPEEATEEAPATEAEEAEAPAAEEAPETETEQTEAPAAEEEAAAPAAEEAAPDPAAVSQKKPKRKHVPRSERHKHSKPRRERPAERKAITRTPQPESERGRRQERRGVVVSSAMDKTIIVKVDTTKAHPRYKKVVRRSVKFHAHDEQNAANVGDVVRIVETRPLSKTKRWRLVQVVEAAK